MVLMGLGLVKSRSGVLIDWAIIEDVHLRVMIIGRTGDVVQKSVTTYI